MSHLPTPTPQVQISQPGSLSGPLSQEQQATINQQNHQLPNQQVSQKPAAIHADSSSTNEKGPEAGEDFHPSAFDGDDDGPDAFGDDMDTDSIAQAQAIRDQEMAKIMVTPGTARTVPEEVLKVYNSTQVKATIRNVWQSLVDDSARKMMGKLDKKIDSIASKLGEPQGSFSIPWLSLQHQIEQIITLTEEAKENEAAYDEFPKLIYASAMFFLRMKELRIPIMETIPQKVKQITGKDIRRMLEHGLTSGPHQTTSSGNTAGNFAGYPDTTGIPTNGTQGGLGNGMFTNGSRNAGGSNLSAGGTGGTNTGSTDLTTPPTREQRGMVASLGRGITAVGMIEAVKPYGNGCRVLLNSGTALRPRYRLYSGKDFGRGAHKTLLEDFRGTWQTGDIRKRTWAEVARVDYAVQSAGNPASSKSAHGYVHVIYNNKNSQPQYPDEWLTFSDFLSLAGKANASQHFASIQNYNRLDEEYFSLCAQNSIHPDTTLLLSAEEKQNMPWLSHQLTYIEPRMPDRVRDVAYKKAVLAPPTLLIGGGTQAQGLGQNALQAAAPGNYYPLAGPPRTFDNTGGTSFQPPLTSSDHAAFPVVGHAVQSSVLPSQPGFIPGVNTVANQFAGGVNPYNMALMQAGPGSAMKSSVNSMPFRQVSNLDGVANPYNMPSVQTRQVPVAHVLGNQIPLSSMHAGSVPEVNTLTTQVSNYHLTQPPLRK
ncbi:MAG: hypothetical protein Q9187_000505 [Circinaria calcarea]